MLAFSKEGEARLRAFFNQLNGELVAVALLDRPTIDGRIWTDGRVSETTFATLLRENARRLEKCERLIRQRHELLNFGAQLEKSVATRDLDASHSSISIQNRHQPSKFNAINTSQKTSTAATTDYSSSRQPSVAMVSEGKTSFHAYSNNRLNSNYSAALAIAPDELLDVIALEIQPKENRELQALENKPIVLKSSQKKTSRAKDAPNSKAWIDSFPPLALVQVPSHDSKAVALLKLNGHARRSQRFKQNAKTHQIPLTHFVDTGDGASPITDALQFTPTSKSLHFWAGSIQSHHMEDIPSAFAPFNTFNHPDIYSISDKMNTRRHVVKLATELCREFSEAAALVDVKSQEVLFISQEAFRLMGCFGPFLENTCLSKKASVVLRHALNLGVKPARIVHSVEILDGVKLLAFQRNVGESEVGRAKERYGFTRAETREALSLAAGLSIKESAIRLDLSPETVRQRRKVMYRKMGVTSHGEAVARIFEIHLAPQLLPACHPRSR